MQSQNIARIEDLYFRRGDRLIFDGLSLDVPKGKVVVIMGPSGTGKTTLLRLLGGQLRPESGFVEVRGEEINQLKRKDLYRLRKKMGVLFQAGALFTDLNVFENVAFSLRIHTKLDEEMIRDLVFMKLQAVGLRGAADLMPSELSGGMSRRVALARAIAMDPAIMMYDEPFTGQDPISKGVLLKLIRQLNDALNMTSIVVTHDVYEAKKIADVICVISEGKVLGQGSPEEIMNSDIPAVRQFLHGYPDGTVPFHFPAKPYEEDLGL